MCLFVNNSLVAQALADAWESGEPATNQPDQQTSPNGQVVLTRKADDSIKVASVRVLDPAHNWHYVRSVTPNQAHISAVMCGWA
jgi:hypothetical protein